MLILTLLSSEQAYNLGTVTAPFFKQGAGAQRPYELSPVSHSQCFQNVLHVC
jgi:hypothetical protein